MLFQELNKIKSTSVILAMILMTLGITLVICPDHYIDALIEGLGYIMLVAAVVMILEYMISKKVLINSVMLALALVIALLGMSVLVFRNDVLRILSWTFGIVMILQGLETLYISVAYVRPSGRKGWWVLTVLAALLLAIGVLIIVNPWWETPRALMAVIGTALLFDALVWVLRLIWIWPIKAE